MIQLPAPINPDTIASLGDPWVAAMNEADLNRQLEGIPRGAGGAIDYNAAALKLLGRHPLAAAQLQRMAAQQQTAGHQGAQLDIERQRLDIQRNAENKFQPGEDDDGNKFVFRPVTGERIWTSGPNAGRTEQIYAPGAAGTQRTGPVTPTQVPPRAPRPAPSPLVTGATSNAGNLPVPGIPAPANPAPVTPSTAGDTLQSDAALIRGAVPAGTPAYDQAIGALAKQYGIPPAQAKLLVEGRSETGPEENATNVQRAGLDLPDEIGGAMAQTSPEQSQGLIQPTPRHEREALQPGQPYTGVYGGSSGKEERAARGEYYKHLATEEAKAQVKNQEKAAQIREYWPNVKFAEDAYDRIAAAGLNNAATGSSVGQSVLSLGRGLYKGAEGVFTGKQDEKPGRVAGGIDAMSAFNSNVSHLEQMARQSQRGLGPLTEGEGAQLRLTLPSLSSNDPKDVKRAFLQVRTILINAIRRGGMQEPEGR